MSERQDKITSDGTHLNGHPFEIPEGRYASDVALHDRFVSFSSEIMKLAIGGIISIGFILTLLAGKNTLPSVAYDPAFAITAMISASCFALSAGSSLVHRFLAADGLFHHLRAIKHRLLVENLPTKPQVSDVLVTTAQTMAKSDEVHRNRKLKLSEQWLHLSGGLLFAGLVFFVSAIVVVLCIA